MFRLKLLESKALALSSTLLNLTIFVQFYHEKRRLSTSHLELGGCEQRAGLPAAAAVRRLSRCHRQPFPPKVLHRGGGPFLPNIVSLMLHFSLAFECAQLNTCDALAANVTATYGDTVLFSESINGVDEIPDYCAQTVPPARAEAAFCAEANPCLNISCIVCLLVWHLDGLVHNVPQAEAWRRGPLPHARQHLLLCGM